MTCINNNNNNSGMKEKLEELYQLELRIVSLLSGAAEVIEATEDCQNVEEMRQAIVKGKTLSQKMLLLRSELHTFIDNLPRSDFPSINQTLLNRYFLKEGDKFNDTPL